MKIQTRKGFTLTELLIVMAIIVVLAAVAVPTFGKQLETSRETGDMEIIRNAYTEALSIAILDAADGAINGKLNDASGSASAGDKVGGLTYKGNGTYEVALADMNKAAFSQRVAADVATAKDGTTADARQAAWVYVSSDFMGRTVPIVDTEKKLLRFTFKILESSDLTTAGSFFKDKGYSVGDVVLTADTSTPTFAIHAVNVTTDT